MCVVGLWIANLAYFYFLINVQVYSIFTSMWWIEGLHNIYLLFFFNDLKFFVYLEIPPKLQFANCHGNSAVSRWHGRKSRASLNIFSSLIFPSFNVAVLGIFKYKLVVEQTHSIFYVIALLVFNVFMKYLYWLHDHITVLITAMRATN